MKIKSIRLENFRSFRNETININRYSCFVGPNGAGKSSVLTALNVFFREQNASTTDVAKLVEEDYFCRDTSQPIRITITFDDLNQAAKDAMSAYVRQEELVVTAEAKFEAEAGIGAVKHYGQRLAMAEFAPFFEADKAGAKAGELNPIFDHLRQVYPDLPAARSKDDKAEALRAYEAAHPDKCMLIPSEDNFYGVSGTSKLAPFIQWVYVPAVKDAGEEGQESKNTALGKLIARAVRARTNFDTELTALRTEALEKYRELLERNQESLRDISHSLQRRLEAWAHPNVRLGVEWLSDPSKAVSVQQPVAGIKTGDGEFLGNLTRMGHGLQRSYLLALLQELAGSEQPDAPTLILGCEEPELYQHPPQARHLAEVFSELAHGNNQILVTTHSPLFVNGNGFENVRLVRRGEPGAGTTVSSITFQALCDRIRDARGEDPQRPIEGLVARIHQALQPGIAEMFFAHIPILVEGLEEISYLTTELHLSGQWSDFRRLGCHLIPVNGKDKLIQPLAMAIEFGLPVFVIFDADGDAKPQHRGMHEKDNAALMNLLGIAGDAFPAANILGDGHAIWQTNLTNTVRADYPEADYQRITEEARIHYSHERGLDKNHLYIADWVSTASAENLRSQTLAVLCNSILKFAGREE